MPFPLSPAANNLLLKALPRTDLLRILKRSTLVEFEVGTVLSESGGMLEKVYFPTEGAISQTTPAQGKPDQELMLIGREGMLGATLLLGINAAPFRSVVKWRGAMLRMTATQFRRELLGCRALQRIIGKYLFVRLLHWAQAVSCVSHHDVDARLVRMLLEAHDRAGSDHFFLTQQGLADALGVQRSAVTIAAGKLQRQQIIRYRRGEISILSRVGLEALACACQAQMVQQSQRWLPA